MNILVTLDANYIRPLSVMLHSLVRADDCPKFDLYIAHSSLTDENIDSIFRGIDASMSIPSASPTSSMPTLRRRTG